MHTEAWMALQRIMLSEKEANLLAKEFCTA
jgi:hypothetical protein